MNLLHLDSSALGAHSVSRELSAAVVADYLQRDPATAVTYHDLAAAPLAHWTPVADAADPDVARGAAMLEEFLAADVVVIGAPMYNFSVPSQLKAWIDRIAIAGKTFRYTAEGPQGLAGGKKIVIASARGGVYSAGPSSAADFQENYLRAVFGFLGVTEIEFIRAEGLAYSNEHKAEAIRDAKAAITDSPRIAA